MNKRMPGKPLNRCVGIIGLLLFHLTKDMQTYVIPFYGYTSFFCRTGVKPVRAKPQIFPLRCWQLEQEGERRGVGGEGVGRELCKPPWWEDAQCSLGGCQVQFNCYFSCLGYCEQPCHFREWERNLILCRRTDASSASFRNRKVSLKQNLWADDVLEVWVQFLWMEKFLCELKLSSPREESKTQTLVLTHWYKLKAKTQRPPYVVARCTEKY